MEFFYGVFDNDKSRELAYLDEERRAIEDTLATLDNENTAYIRPVIKNDIGLIDLKRDLTRYANRMTIFHFSGHHGKGKIQLSDQKIRDEGIIDTLNNCGKLKMVFLNGCCTESIVTELKNVPIVIGTKTPVLDNFAKEVSTRFYQLMVDNIEYFKDATEIQQKFELAKSIDSIEGDGTKRGEGSIEELTAQLDNYTLKINENADDFQQRVNYNMNLEEVPVKVDFKNRIYKWYDTLGVPESHHPQQVFHSYFPKNLSFLLEKLSPDRSSDASKMLCLERYKIIKAIFFSTLVFYRHCGFSILWTYYLKHKKDKQLPDDLKNRMQEALGVSWFLNNPDKAMQIEDRLKLITDIYQHIHDLKIDNIFAKETFQFLTDQQQLLIDFCPCFSLDEDAPKIAPKCLFQTEEFLHFFVDHCNYLQHYALASVYGSVFYKYRTGQKDYEFEIRYFPKGESKKHYKTQADEQIYDVYSVILVDKRSVDHNEALPIKPLLNLSPFFVDVNVEEQNADQIHLMCYDYYYEVSDDELLLEYRQLDDIEEKINVNTNKLYSTYLSDSIKVDNHLKDFLSLIS